MRLRRVSRFRLNSPMELTAAPELSADGFRFNLAQIIAPIRKNTLRLTLPTVTKVRAQIKTDRAEWAAKRHRKGETFKASYDFGPGLPSVDANYLIDFLQLFPDGEAFTSEQKPISPPSISGPPTVKAFSAPSARSPKPPPEQRRRKGHFYDRISGNAKSLRRERTLCAC